MREERLHSPRPKWTNAFMYVGIRLIVLIIGILIAMLFQNCGQFVVNPNLGSTKVADFASTGGSDLVPKTDKIDENCMGSSSYDACIFNKNPVATRGSAFPIDSTSTVSLPAAIASASLDATQVYGVKLTGISKSGNLESGTVRIFTLTGEPVSTAKTDHRYRVQNDGQQLSSQVMAYYWMNRATEYLEARTGLFPAKGKNIAVYVDDTFAGWAPKTNSIHLKNDEGGNRMAWSADLAIHFLGLANLHYASGGAISSLGTGSANKHVDCGLKANGCCASETGCARAIASGVGDYFVAMMFPTQPTIGETWSNSLNGMGFCGLSRDLNQAASRTVATAYNACAGSSGNVTNMGSVYASIWWKVRATAANQGAGGAADIDKIFMHHLALLTGGDDFRTALPKILSVDQRLTNGAYSSLFEAEFASRGL